MASPQVLRGSINSRVINTPGSSQAYASMSSTPVQQYAQAKSYTGGVSGSMAVASSGGGYPRSGSYTGQVQNEYLGPRLTAAQTPGRATTLNPTVGRPISREEMSTRGLLADKGTPSMGLLTAHASPQSLQARPAVAAAGTLRAPPLRPSAVVPPTSRDQFRSVTPVAALDSGSTDFVARPPSSPDELQLLRAENLERQAAQRRGLRAPSENSSLTPPLVQSQQSEASSRIFPTAAPEQTAAREQLSRENSGLKSQINELVMVCGKVENELTSEKARSAALQKQIELLEAKAEATASAATTQDTALQELAAEKQRNAALEAAASSFKDTALKELATEKEHSAALEAKVNELLAMCKELQDRKDRMDLKELQAKQDAAAADENLQRFSVELRNAEGFNQQLEQELQKAKAMIDALNVEIANEAAEKQQLHENLNAVTIQQRAAESREAQALSMELSRAQSRNVELETQLMEAVSMHNQAEEKLAAEAIKAGEMREMLAAAEAQAENVAIRAESTVAGLEQRLAHMTDVQAASQAQFADSQQAAAVVDTEESRQLHASYQARVEALAAEITALQAELNACQVELRECKEAKSKPESLNSPPKSPSRMDHELRRHQSRVVDLEAQLLDSKDRIKDMEARAAQQEERMAGTLQQLAQSQQQVRQASLLGQDGSNGAKFLSEAIVGWMPNLQKRRKTLASSLSDSAFEAVAKDDIDALKAALINVERPVETVLAARNAPGQTLLHVALANASGEAAKFILEQGSKWAANHKYMYELQGELLERQMSAFVNGEDSTGCTPLQALCQRPEPGKDEEGIIVALLEASADPMSRDSSGVTPFIECARSGNTPIMRMLLQITRGAVLLDSDDLRRSALHWGVSAEKKSTVELLLKVKADSDVADIDGTTPLEVATAAGYEEIVKLLVDGVEDSDDDDDDDEGGRKGGDGEEEEKANKGKGQGKGKEFSRMAPPGGDMDDFVGDFGDMDDIGNQASPNIAGGADDEEPELRRPFPPGRVGPGGVLRPEGFSEFSDQDDFVINADEVPPEFLMAAMAQGMMSPEDFAGPGSPLGAMMMGSAMGGFPGYPMPTGMDDADMVVDTEMHGMPGIPGMPTPTSPGMTRSPGSNTRETFSM